MSTLLSELLDLVRQEYARDRFLVPPGATTEELEDLGMRMTREFGLLLPAKYDELLSSINGFAVGPFLVAGTSRQPVRLADGRPYGDVEIPDVVTHAREIAIDYAPQLAGLITVTWGPSLHGWDPQTQTWFRAYYDTGITREYGSLEELLADLLHDSGIDSRALMPMTFKFSCPDATGRPVFGSRRE